MHLIEGFVFIKSALVQLAASILDNKHQRKRGPRCMAKGRGAALCSGRPERLDQRQTSSNPQKVAMNLDNNQSNN
jgi:hypothetical protein